MKRSTISIVLATYNEEKNIKLCLESVKDFADEIIIVDGSSSDQTVAIAKNFSAKIINADNPTNFHINKQKAIDAATKDWILQLDADERVTLELADEIHSKIINRSNINGYWIPRKNWFLGRFLMKGGVYPDYTLRLYKRGKGRLPMKDVHEQAVVDGKTEYFENPLIHMADPEFSRYIKRFDRYTSFISQQMKEKNEGKDPWSMIKYIVVLPLWWFGKSYLRHKGFMDSWQGLVFSFFSSMRFPVSYIKYIKTS